MNKFRSLLFHSWILLCGWSWTLIKSKSRVLYFEWLYWNEVYFLFLRILQEYKSDWLFQNGFQSFSLRCLLTLDWELTLGNPFIVYINLIVTSKNSPTVIETQYCFICRPDTFKNTNFYLCLKCAFWCSDKSCKWELEKSGVIIFQTFQSRVLFGKDKNEWIQVPCFVFYLVHSSS